MSCGRQSKAFERSIRIAAIYWILSRAVFQSSRSLSKVGWQPWPFLKAHKKVWTIFSNKSVRDRPFNLKGGYGFLFSSEMFFRTTRELEYFFFLSHKARWIFFQNSTLGYMTKTLNQIIFFSSTKIRIFCSATLGIRIFF